MVINEPTTISDESMTFSPKSIHFMRHQYIDRFYCCRLAQTMECGQKAKIVLSAFGPIRIMLYCFLLTFHCFASHRKREQISPFYFYRCCNVSRNLKKIEHDKSINAQKKSTINKQFNTLRKIEYDKKNLCMSRKISNMKAIA